MIGAHSGLQAVMQGILVLAGASPCALHILFQAIHCLLIKRVRRMLNRQDGVAVVAGPLHTFVIHVAGVFHCDELFIHQCGDVLHHSVDGQAGGICDGVVAGMALVRAAVLTAE